MNAAEKNSTVHHGPSSAVISVGSESTEPRTKQDAKERGLKFFNTGKPCTKGHTSERYVSDGKCRKCVSERNSQRYDPEKRRIWYENYYPENSHKVKEYQAINREKILKDKKLYREINRQEINKKKKNWTRENQELVRRYRVLNQSRIKGYNAVYYSVNKDRISKRVKLYNENNPLGSFVRSTVRRLERAKSAERIDRAELALGYTQKEFMTAIESKFKEGMNWKNRHEWHIDHIKPVSAFLKEGITDIKVINALSNLQPLWAWENLEKYNKWESR